MAVTPLDISAVPLWTPPRQGPGVSACPHAGSSAPCSRQLQGGAGTLSAGRSAPVPASSPGEAVPGLGALTCLFRGTHLCLELGGRQRTLPGFCNALQPT